MDAIVWLEEYLKSWKGTLILISHDRDFLDSVITHLAHLHNQKLKMFTGSYSSFEKQWAEQLVLEQKHFQKQEQLKAHLQNFVDRFRAKATKAKQAQSRMKMLERIEDVAITKVASPFHFEFAESASCPNPILTAEEINLGYDDKVVLSGLSCQVNAGQRIALLGPNGAGKSTLIKGLAQTLNPQVGEISIHKNARIGYFAQHQLEQLDADKTPISFFRKAFPKDMESKLRGYLGGFGFSQERALTQIEHLSGGEKARLVLAMIVRQNPNFLLLDEPTNHLDLMMREALADALQSYTGSLVLISHDRYLIRAVCDELWLVANSKVEPFSGDMDDYLAWLIEHVKQKNAASKNEPKKKADPTLEKEITAADKHVEKLTNQLEKINAELADPNLYTDENTDRVTTLTNKKMDVATQLHAAEQLWYELNQKMEGHDE